MLNYVYVSIMCYHCCSHVFLTSYLLNIIYRGAPAAPAAPGPAGLVRGIIYIYIYV